MLGRNYFKGWYFKCIAGNKTIAFIPSYNRGGGEAGCSLQIITDERSYTVPFRSVEFTERPLEIKIGRCLFSERGIVLNISRPGISAKGRLRFSAISPIKYDIMGPFALVPFMECRHSVFSMSHRIDGELVLDGERYVFKGGDGYIEGDCGYSFPKRYIWTQSRLPCASLMLAAADIPFAGLSFPGVIGVIQSGGEELRLATYLGARLIGVGKDSVRVRQGGYVLSAEIIKRNAKPLSAPQGGRMSRTIYESASCTARYRLSYRDRLLFDEVCDRASFGIEYK